MLIQHVKIISEVTLKTGEMAAENSAWTSQEYISFYSILTKKKATLNCNNIL